MFVNVCVMEEGCTTRLCSLSKAAHSHKHTHTHTHTHTRCSLKMLCYRAYNTITSVIDSCDSPCLALDSNPKERIHPVVFCSNVKYHAQPHTLKQNISKRKRRDMKI